MKTIPWLALTAVLVLACALGGCSGDDNGTGPVEEAPPVFGASYEPPGVPAAMAGSPDPHAADAAAFVDTIGLAGGHFVFLVPPGKALERNGPPWTYTWDHVEGTTDVAVTLVIDEFSLVDNDLWSWRVWFDGTVDGHVYDDARVYNAWESKDGTAGQLEWSDPPPTQPVMQWDWRRNPDGSLEYVFDPSAIGPPITQLTCVIRADGSGGLDRFLYGSETWIIDERYTWDALGNGAWIDFANGVQVDAGYWGDILEPPAYGASFVMPAVPDGMANSLNTYAALGTAHANLYARASEHLVYFAPPDGAERQGGPPWTRVWTRVGPDTDVEITMHVDAMPGDDTVWTWDLGFDGTLDGVVYADHALYAARESVNGTAGHLAWYPDPALDRDTEWDWRLNADGSYIYWMVVHGPDEPEERTALTVYVDGSGEMDILDWVVDQWIIQYHLEWDAPGNGSWISFDGGTPDDDGIWTAAGP